MLWLGGGGGGDLMGDMRHYNSRMGISFSDAHILSLAIIVTKIKLKVTNLLLMLPLRLKDKALCRDSQVPSNF